MGVTQLHGIGYLVTGVILFGLAIFFFSVSRKGAKRFLRVLVEENPTVEDDYRMMRGLLSLLVSGSFFLFFAVWGLIRLLNVDAWMNMFGWTF